MKLSIIIPTYNSGAVIDRALKSILAQTFTDWEVLIMDGLSTDDTVSIAESFNDLRIHVYSEPDKGIYDAMNKGIKKAQGEWLYFLGSDDWLLENSLARLFKNDLEQYDIVYGNIEAEHNVPEYDGEWNAHLLEYNRCHQAIFYRKDVLVYYKGYNIKYKMFADWDLNLKWFFSRHFSNRYFDIKIAHFSDGGKSSAGDDVFMNNFARIVLVRGRSQLDSELRKHYLFEYLTHRRIGRVIINLHRLLSSL